MRPALAIEELTKLKTEAESTDGFTGHTGDLDSWKARVRLVIVRSLGADNNLVKKLDDVRYGPMVAWSGMPEDSWKNAQRSGVRTALGYVDAAIYELGFIGGDEPVDEHAYDPELWAHVKTQVEDGDWAKVASQTAIFIENQIRTWAGDPKEPSGNNMVGKQLFNEVFGKTFPLGAQPGEAEGWRFLGMGFAQALSNVDRHRIQTRDDAKRYALGVLGVASLLLTQLRYEHGAKLPKP
jgi:hypothetical protein